MVGSQASQTKSKAWATATMLASTHGEADEMARKVTLLGDELAVACQAQSKLRQNMRAWWLIRQPTPTDDRNRSRGIAQAWSRSLLVCGSGGLSYV
jgi:hypothetical protein